MQWASVYVCVCVCVQPWCCCSFRARTPHRGVCVPLLPEALATSHRRGTPGLQDWANSLTNCSYKRTLHLLARSIAMRAGTEDLDLGCRAEAMPEAGRNAMPLASPGGVAVAAGEREGPAESARTCNVQGGKAYELEMEKVH